MSNKQQLPYPLDIIELQADMEQYNSEETSKQVSDANCDPKTPQNQPPQKLVSPSKIDRMETAATTKSKDSPAASSKESDDCIIMDGDPNDIKPSQMDILLTDIDSLALSDLRRVEYLSPEDQTTLVNQTGVAGKILYQKIRFVINLPCRRESRRNDPPRAALPYHNVFFVIDTGSNYSYLCPEAMAALLPAGNPIPGIIRMELCSGRIFDFHLSPPGSHFSDVNILGGNVVRTMNLALVVKRCPSHCPSRYALSNEICN